MTPILGLNEQLKMCERILVSNEQLKMCERILVSNRYSDNSIQRSKSPAKIQPLYRELTVINLRTLIKRPY